MAFYCFLFLLVLFPTHASTTDRYDGPTHTYAKVTVVHIYHAFGPALFFFLPMSYYFGAGWWGRSESSPKPPTEIYPRHRGRRDSSYQEWFLFFCRGCVTSGCWRKKEKVWAINTLSGAVFPKKKIKNHGGRNGWGVTWFCFAAFISSSLVLCFSFR